MDASNWTAALLTSSSFATITAALWFTYRCINHQQVRSRCCGFVAELAIDIGPTPIALASSSDQSVAPVRAPLPPRTADRVTTVTHDSAAAVEADAVAVEVK